MSKKRLTDERIADILGASRTVLVDGRPSRGPLDLLSLRREIQERLKSSGGRPTDPAWTLCRSIRFKPEHWHRLEELAQKVSDASRRVGPGQLAAILVEKALSEVDRK